MGLSHISLPTGQKSYKAMRDFYAEVLAPIGYKTFMEEEGKFYSMAPKHGAPDFWLHCSGTEFDRFDGDIENRRGATHLAFDASSMKQVDEWHKLAL